MRISTSIGAICLLTGVAEAQFLPALEDTAQSPSHAAADTGPDPKAAYVQSGLAGEESAVRRTPEKADDLALAAKLIEAAKDAKAQPRLRALLYDRAIDLAQSDVAGLRVLRVAAEGLVQADPSRGHVEEVLMEATGRLVQVSRSPKARSIRATRAHAQQVERVADVKASEGEIREALALYQRATGLYRQANVDRSRLLDAKVQACREAGNARLQDERLIADAQTRRQRLEAAAAAARAQAQAAPSDPAARQALAQAAAPLATLLVVEFDEPELAKQAADHCGDEEIGRIVSLLLQDTHSLEAADALTLGRWLANVAAEEALHLKARQRCTQLAIDALGRYLASSDPADPQRWTVQQQHQSLTQRLVDLNPFDLNMGGTSTASIPEDAVTFNGHSYKLYNVALSWHDAKRRCDEMGGHLVVVETPEEQQFVQAMMPDAAAFRWMGGTDEHREGDWLWLNGSEARYANWNGYEPSRRDGGHYLAMDQYGTWHDLPTATLSAYTCEWPDLRPEPATPPQPERRSAPTPPVEATAPPQEPATVQPPPIEPPQVVDVPTTPEPEVEVPVASEPEPPKAEPEPTPKPKVTKPRRKPLPGELFPDVGWEDEDEGME